MATAADDTSSQGLAHALEPMDQSAALSSSFETCGISECPANHITLGSQERHSLLKHQWDYHPRQGLTWLAAMRAKPGVHHTLAVQGVNRGKKLHECSVCLNLVCGSKECLSCKGKRVTRSHNRCTPGKRARSLSAASYSSMLEGVSEQHPQSTSTARRTQSQRDKRLRSGSSVPPSPRRNSVSNGGRGIITDGERANASSAQHRDPASAFSEGSGPRASTSGSGAEGAPHEDHDADSFGEGRDIPIQQPSTQQATQQRQQSAPANDDTRWQRWQRDAPAIMGLRQHRDLVCVSSFDTVKQMSSKHAEWCTEMLIRCMEVISTEMSHPPSEQREMVIEAWSLLKYLLPGLLFSPDPRYPREERFRLVLILDLEDIVFNLLLYAGGKAVRSSEARSDAAQYRRVSRISHLPGGLTKAARELSSTERIAPATSETRLFKRPEHGNRFVTSSRAHQSRVHFWTRHNLRLHSPGFRRNEFSVSPICLHII
jgi:hypothetical protein